MQSLDSVCPKKNKVEQASKCLAKNTLCLFTLVVIMVFACVLFYENPDGFIGGTESSTVSNDDDGLNYAIVIDAGSSGSRAYLYFWPEHSGSPKSLLKIDPLVDKHGEPLVKAVSPGLSSLSESPSNAREYIAPLLDYAAQQIPASQHSSTHLFILATAGMRLLSAEKQRAILDHLRQGITENYQFLFPESNLEVISGKDEGIYQWISINYVLGKLDPERKSGEESDKGPRTVGAIDMGGASMQIAMEIFPDGLLQSLSGPDKNQIDELNLAAVPSLSDDELSYKIFVTTFLGYGANEAMARHRRSLLLSQLEKPKKIKNISGLTPDDRMNDPCLPQGLMDNITLNLDPKTLTAYEGEKLKKLFGKADKSLFLVGTGDWNECYIELSKFTRSREMYLKSCKPGDDGCPDAGMRRPPIDFFTTEFYAFSEFWYTSEDVLKLGGVYVFDKFKQASQDFCREDWNIIFEKYTNGAFPTADVDRLKTQCFKSAWVAVALHQGLAFPESYSHLTAAPNSINGRVIHWTLGALIYRTRFIPRSAIETHLRYSHSRFYIFFSDNSHFIVLLLIATFITFTILYLRRLRRFVQPNSSLRRVPTLGFMTSSSNNVKPSAAANEGEWTLLRTYSDDDESTPDGTPTRITISS